MEAGAETDSKKQQTNLPLEDLELQARIKFREKRLREILSPLEGYILQLQSLLVWEKPRRSAVMFIIVNVIFWLACSTQYHIVFLVAVCAIIYVCVETIYSKVWPEIRVQPAEPEDEEGWTPVHPNLLSLPELCQYLGKIWVTIEDYWARLWQLRQQTPAKFCLYVCSTCLILAGAGQQIPGLILTYFILMGLLLWPCLEYHQFTKQIHDKLKPFFKQFESSVEQSSYQSRRARGSDRPRHRAYAAARRELLGESDSELEEFCPTPGPSIDAALAQAATMTPSVGSLRATPVTMFSVGIMPRGLSLDDDGHTTDNEGNSFMGGLSSMPAHDDGLLDHSADELDIELPRDSHPPSQATPPPPRIISSPPDKMKFVSTHFEESSSDDEFGLSHDVRIPNYDTFDRGDRGRHPSGGPLSGAMLPPAAAQLLSSTVASVMQDALATVGQLATTTQTDYPGATAETVQSDRSKHHSHLTDDRLEETKHDDDAALELRHRQLKPSDSAELVDQFEMLDQSELTSLENEPSDQGNTSTGTMSRLSDYGMGLINSWWPGKQE